jgi:hypothetical protein
MVDALTLNQEKLDKAYLELQGAKDPVKREEVITKIDNLLDIRLSIKRHDKEVEAMANGN